MTTDERTWTYTATTRHPDGITVTTTVRVPLSAAWKHVDECAEHAQMTTATAMTGIVKSKFEDEMECPF